MFYIIVHEDYLAFGLLIEDNDFKDKTSDFENSKNIDTELMKIAARLVNYRNYHIVKNYILVLQLWSRSSNYFRIFLTLYTRKQEGHQVIILER